MTPKEKAKELVERYDFILTHDGLDIMDEELTMLDRKQCALIAVDEILNEIPEFFKDSIQTFKGNIKIDVPNCSYDFWKQVKQEIEKL